MVLFYYFVGFDLELLGLVLVGVSDTPQGKRLLGRGHQWNLIEAKVPVQEKKICF